MPVSPGSQRIETVANVTVSGPMLLCDPILSVRGLSKSFGPVTALNQVSLDVYPGEIRAVCGENGAGKSTLVNILAGIDRPDAGTICFDGEVRTLSSSTEAQRLGIAMVAQELSVCPDLSVLDNIWLGSMDVPFLHRRKELRRRAHEALNLLGAEQIALDMPVGRLTIGERQLVEIARMFTRNARVFILDEPTATLSDSEIDRIFVALARIRREGRSIVYVTHRLAEVFRICDSVTVLRNGEIVGTSKTTDVDRKKLIEMMLGRPFVEMYPEHGYVAGETILQIENLSIPGAVSNFSARVLRGDIICIAGQVGSGAESVARTVAGLGLQRHRRCAGKRQTMRLGSADEAFHHNIRFVSGDRAEEGIFRTLSVTDNLVATRLREFSRFGFLNRKMLRSEALRLAARVGVDQQRLRSRAEDLSGGNQQKLAFGRCLGGAQAGVIVLIEPTRGIDIGARADIYQLMRDFCSHGYGLLIASTDLEEVVGMGRRRRHDVSLPSSRLLPRQGDKYAAYHRRHHPSPPLDTKHPMNLVRRQAPASMATWLGSIRHDKASLIQWGAAAGVVLFAVSTPGFLSRDEHSVALDDGVFHWLRRCRDDIYHVERQHHVVQHRGVDVRNDHRLHDEYIPWSRPGTDFRFLVLRSTQRHSGLGDRVLPRKSA